MAIIDLCINSVGKLLHLVYMYNLYREQPGPNRIIQLHTSDSPLRSYLPLAIVPELDVWFQCTTGHD
jgi:hypothetical protein